MQQRAPDVIGGSQMDNYQQIDLGSAALQGKPASHKLNMDSERAISKMTRTTAASANMTRMDRGGGGLGAHRSQIQSKQSHFGAQSVVANVTKPRS